MKPRISTSIVLAVALACVSPPQEAAPTPEPDVSAPEISEPPILKPAPPTEPEVAKEAIKRYTVESGIVRYELGGAQSGREELYFLDYGRREAKYTKGESTTATGTSNPIDRLVLIEGSTQHVIDLSSNTGETLANMFAPLGGRAGASFAKSKVPPSLLMLQAMGGKKTGTRVVAGVECEVWSAQGGAIESCLVGGVMLSTTRRMGGHEKTETAVEVEFGVEIPADKFAIPEGVELGKFGQRSSQGPR